MSNYLDKRIKGHKVKHLFSGKRHIYDVKTKEDREHSIIIQTHCDCTFTGVQGVANAKACSHILAVFKYCLKHKDFKKNE